jgi:hypothetical protein
VWRWIGPLLALLLLPLAACGPKRVEEPVYSSPNARVSLRRIIESGEPVARGYEHPVIIADVRVAHILALLSYEDPEQARNAAIRSEQVYDIAEGMARALEKAGPDDEVVVAAFSRERRLGIFTQDRVTSFRSWVGNGQLHLEFYAVNQILEEPGVANESEVYRIPLETPERAPRFRLVAGRGMAVSGPRTIVVDWRDPYFRQPVGMKVGGAGVRRQTVLMEAEEGPVVAPQTEGLSDAEIRALDQLEAARRSGLVTEAEFQRRRRLVLEGRFGEAGFEEEP